MTLEYIVNYESTERILKALLDDRDDISSISSEWKYLTTRIANQISALRKTGIEIETRNVKIPNSKKYYGRYLLIQNENNIKRVNLLLEMLSTKISHGKMEN